MSSLPLKHYGTDRRSRVMKAAAEVELWLSGDPEVMLLLEHHGTLDYTDGVDFKLIILITAS